MRARYCVNVEHLDRQFQKPSLGTVDEHSRCIKYNSEVTTCVSLLDKGSKRARHNE